MELSKKADGHIKYPALEGKEDLRFELFDWLKEKNLTVRQAINLLDMGQVLCFSKDDIIVVDPMGEYKDIAAAWGGQYINLTQSAENVFYVNPFHVPDVVPDIDRFVAEKAEFAYLYRNEPELNRCTEKPFYENNGFQFRIYAFAGSGNNGQGSGRRFV